MGGGGKWGSLRDLSLSMLTGTLAALGADGHDSPGCAPIALCSPGSGPVPQLTTACSPLPARCEAGSEAAGGSKGRMNIGSRLSSLACLPWLPRTAPNTVPHLTLCGQPTGAQVQLLVGLTQLLALDLKLCSLQLQPRQAAPQLPTFTLELPSLPRYLSQ